MIHHRCLLLSAITIIGLCLLIGPSRAESPQEAPPEQPAAAEADAPVAPSPATVEQPATETTAIASSDIPKKLRFNFRYQPWAEVLNWFAEQAGYSLVLDYPPQGTFNYRDDRDYTPAEAIDLLNSVLLTKGYTLVLRDRMLMVVNLQDEIPPSLVARVTPDELDSRGKYELLSTRFALKNLSAEDAQKEIEKLLGPQGQIVVLPKARQLVVRETGGRLREIRDVLDRADRSRDPAEQEVRWFELSSVSPDEAVAMLRQIFEIEETANVTPDGSLRLATDPIGLRVLASGTPERLAQVAKILKTVDQPLDGEPVDTATQGAPQLEVYDLAPADPDSVLKVMQTLLADSPGVRLATDPKTGNLIALARPKEQATIRATIDQIRRDAQSVEVIQLRVIDPQLAVLAVGKLFGGDANNAPSVDADLANRQLLIRGSVGQIAQVRLLLEKMGETFGPNPAMADGKLRVVPVRGAEAQLLVERLREFWPVLGRNELRIVPTRDEPQATPSHGRSLRQGPIDERTPVPGPTPDADSPNADAPNDSTTRREPHSQPQPRHQVRVTFAAAGVDQLEGDTDPKLSSETVPADPSKPPILILSTPDGLYLSSEDVAALDEIQKLIDTLQGGSTTREPKLTVFYLRNTDAKTVADRLKEILASTASPSPSSTGSSSTQPAPAGILGSLGTVGTLGHITPSGPISITPDPRLNALMVQAAPADVDLIEGILKILDRRDTPEEVPAQAKPRLIPVVHTSASQIAEVVKQVYENRLVGSGGSNNRSLSPPEMMMQMFRGRRGGSSNNPSSTSTQSDQTKMTIGVDERTNSLIVAAPETLFEEVRELVDALDRIASQDHETVEVVTLQQSNPEAVRAALAALFGDAVETSTTSSTTSSRTSSSPTGMRWGGGYAPGSTTGGSSRRSGAQSPSQSRQSRGAFPGMSGGRSR